MTLQEQTRNLIEEIISGNSTRDKAFILTDAVDILSKHLEPQYTEDEIADIIRYEIQKSTVRQGVDRSLQAVKELIRLGAIKVKETI